jgi:hypothetical protein
VKTFFENSPHGLTREGVFPNGEIPPHGTTPDVSGDATPSDGFIDGVTVNGIGVRPMPEPAPGQEPIEFSINGRGKPSTSIGGA